MILSNMHNIVFVKKLVFGECLSCKRYARIYYTEMKTSTLKPNVVLIVDTVILNSIFQFAAKKINKTHELIFTSAKIQFSYA